MSTDTKAADPRVAGPLGDREFRRYVTGLGLIYVGTMLALSAQLLIHPGHHRDTSTPVISRTTSIADDLTAIHSALLPASEHRPSAGYVEFEPPPAAGHGTVGLSRASTTTIQADEPVKPAGRIVAPAQCSSPSGE